MARFGYRVVRDDHKLESMTVDDALIHSSNIGMAILGLKLGPSGLRDMLDSFGFCRSTAIGLPGEAKGRYTPAAKWTPLYSSVSVSFGYELLVSPLQLCRAFAALVNGGFLLKPRIIAGVRRGEVQESFPKRTVLGRPINEETSRQVRDVLRQVVEGGGTGRWLKLDGFEFGGKTGTARMAQGGNYNRDDYLVSFEAFAPYDDPQIVVLCMVEKPRSRRKYGSWVAGPIVVEVLRQLFDVAAECEATLIKRRA
jgi:cell division protein FtsI (penicillin-binding protein 3)